MSRPELQEIDRLRLENSALKYNALQNQVNTLMTERKNIIDQVNLNPAYRGWKWEDPEGFVEIPVEVSKEE